MKRQKETILRQYKDIPYTVIGHSLLTPAFAISLTGKGLKAIAEKIKEEDVVRILVDHKGRTEFTITSYEDENEK